MSESRADGGVAPYLRVFATSWRGRTAIGVLAAIAVSAAIWALRGEEWLVKAPLVIATVIVGVPMLGIFPLISMFLVTSITMLRERTSGTLERLLTTPLTKLELIVGYGIAFAAVAVFQVTVVSIVGFGHVGAAVAKALAVRGARVTAVLTSGAAIYEPGGIDVLALAQHRARTGDIDGFESATAILERDFWSAPCELCILCADDGCLDIVRAEQCRARVVVEVGGASIGADAEEVLVRQGIEIVPDILAGAAGDIASGLEWREARLEPTFRKEDLDAHVRRQMTLAARRVRVARARYECDLRTAAICAALERIGKIYDIRGVFP